MTLAREQIAGVVLAGGLSRRMGGGDKGLRELDGKPLMLHVIERLSRQAAPIAINANGDAARFASFGLPVIPDATGEYAGPLAGVLAGMRWAAQAAPHARFIATAACDTPFFPEDLVESFLAATQGAYPAIVLAMSEEQIHPVFGLWPVALAGDLANALASGTRKVLHWTDRHQNYSVKFPAIELHGKRVDPFFNANTPEELEQAATVLAAEGK